MYVPVLPPACYSLLSYRLTYREEEKEQGRNYQNYCTYILRKRKCRSVGSHDSVFHQCGVNVYLRPRILLFQETLGS